MKEDVLQCLKKHGQRLDLEIAAETRLPLATVRGRLAGPSATGAVVVRAPTRYEGDRTVEALECRLSGHAPKPAPGRKAAAQRGR